MPTSSRWWRILALLLGFMVLAAACGNDDDDPSATPDELIDLQNFAAGEPDHIDPGLAGVVEGAQIGQLLFDTLLEWDWTDRDDPELVGQVAESWDSPDDATTWVFTIKEDQQFSDGTPVLPSSFKKAWDLHASAEYASEINYHFLVIEGAEAVGAGEAEEISGVVADDDDMTLTVTLAQPLADFPADVTHPVFSPKTDEGIAAGADYEQDLMIGNGPFELAEPWQHEVSVTLERNENWNGGIYGEGTLAELERIVFRISQDSDSAYADFEAGNGQTAFIPAGRFAEATENYPDATDRSLGSYHFFIDHENKLGGEENLELRQAIAKGIDRAAINDAVFDGSRRLPTGMTPPGVPGYEEGLCGDLCDHDPEGAQQLLDVWRDGGGSLDGPIRISFNTGSGQEDVVAIMQQNLEDLGLETTLDGRDPTTYFTEMREGGCELCRAGWIWDYPSYDNAAFALLHSESTGNIANYSNAEVDQLISDARETLDDEERFGLYRQAEEIALAEVPLIPVNWYAGQIVYDESVENFEYTPLQFVLYEKVTVAA